VQRGFVWASGRFFLKIGSGKQGHGTQRSKVPEGARHEGKKGYPKNSKKTVGGVGGATGQSDRRGQGANGINGPEEIFVGSARDKKVRRPGRT